LQVAGLQPLNSLHWAVPARLYSMLPAWMP